MDYKKKYKNALEKAKDNYNAADSANINVASFKNTLLALFPELAKSEDERIKEDLIQWINEFPDTIWKDHYKKDILAWLEKQDKKEYALKSFKDEDVCNFMQYIEKQAKAYEFNLPNRGYDIYAFAKDILAWLKKQDKQNLCMIQWKGDNLKEVIDFTGKEKNFEKWFKSFEEYEKYVQEHNGIFKLFNADGSYYEVPVGAWIVKTPDGYNVASKAIFRQKSVDTPKFNIGDWIIYNRNDFSREILYVYDIRDGRYYFNDNIHFSWSVKECDEKCRLWTISDAKKGDILANDHHILILKELNYDWSDDETPSAVKAYCGIKSNGNFEIGKNNWCFCDTLHIYPATEEQRDTLFVKMKEAGYEFDFEKKELKKIEEPENFKNQVMSETADLIKYYITQKDFAVWSEEDEIMFGYALDMIEWYGGKNENKSRLVSDWLKSLKERIKK